MALTLVPRLVAETVIIVPRDSLDKLVATLAPRGLFHPEQPDDDLPGEISREYRRWLSHLTDKTSKFERYFDVLKVSPKSPGSVELKAGNWVSAVEKVESEYSELEADYDEGVRILLEAEARAAELLKMKEFYQRIAGINLDINSVTRISKLSVSIGFIGEEYLESVLDFCEEKGCLVAYEEAGEEEYILLIACPHEVKSEITRILSEYGFQLLRMPESMPSNPSELVEFLDKKIEETLREADEVREKLLEKLEEASKYYHFLLALREAFRLLANAKNTERFTIIQGYVDKSDLSSLEKTVSTATDGSYALDILRFVRRAEEKKPPSRIVLPKILRPFHKIVRMYGEPDPDEVVPTLFLAITMPIIFGLMFPDLGHGLLVLLAAYWFYRKARSEDSRLTWTLVMILGGASMVTGFLAGEFFGPMTKFSSLWEHLGFEHPPLATPLFAIEHGNEEMLNLLVRYALTIPLIVAGVILILGTFLGLVNSILKKEYDELLAIRLPRFMLFTVATMPFLITFDAYEGGGIIKDATLGGMTTLAGKIVGGVGIISILWIMMGEPLIGLVEEGASGLKHGLSKSFMETFEVVLMLLGNIPSFFRIMGLSLAHASLMYGFTILTEMIWTGPIMAIPAILVYIAGNLLTAGLEAIIAFAHSLRLHFYEWFSKFYSGRGVPFEPVSIPSFVSIIISS